MYEKLIGNQLYPIKSNNFNAAWICMYDLEKRVLSIILYTRSKLERREDSDSEKR